MPKFELEKIEEIKGRINFFYLKIDDQCQYKDFYQIIEKEGTYVHELDTLQARFQYISELQRLPETKFRNITPSKETVKEYEVKTKNLRVYLIHQEKQGHIIIFGGKKSNQKKDLKSFRNTKATYLSNLNKTL